MLYLFFFTRYQTLSSYLDNDDVISFKIYLRSSSKAVADKEKERKTEIQKIEYLANQKSFLDEISIFHTYLRAIIWFEYEK